MPSIAARTRSSTFFWSAETLSCDTWTSSFALSLVAWPRVMRLCTRCSAAAFTASTRPRSCSWVPSTRR
jgi:hypothetical protein